MRTIIAGGRDFIDYDKLKYIIKHELPWKITTVICGKAKGADTLGETWALCNSIPIEYFPAEWDKFGKSAGVRRNRQMAQNAETALICWDTKSKGTRNMFQEAKKYNLKTYLYKY